MVFIGMSRAQSDRLAGAGFAHYFIEQHGETDAARMVTSHDTIRSEVEALAAAVRECLSDG